MKLKKILYGCLILLLLSCNYVTRMIVPATATPLPSATSTMTLVPPTSTTVPLVPAYMPPQCADIPPATVAPDAAPPETPSQGANPEIAKSDELDILKKMVKIIREVYVYPDYNGKDLSEIEARYRSKIEAGLDTETFYDEMANLITELGDDHSFYMSPAGVKQAQAELQGENEYVGIGVYGSFDADQKRMTVIATFPDSSAEHAGIQPHDSLLAADNEPILNKTTNRLRGPECSAVLVTVQTPGQEPRQALLIRQSIEGNVRVDARLVATTDGSKIGYMFIPSFYDEAIPGEVEEALNKFGPLDGLILDVRMNGGGISTVANAVMSFFTSGQVGKFVSRKEARPLRLQANPIQNSQTVPLVVLVNKETASYGEIFAGIMRDSRGAKISGESSLGNVEVMHGFDFDDGSQLWLAAETFHPQHSSDNWEDTGIVTDIEAYAPWDTFTFASDPSIAAALTLLGHK